MNTNPLTSRELDVLRMVAAGHSDAAFASELNVSVLTIKSHVQNVCIKIDVRNSTEAAEWAARNGLL